MKPMILVTTDDGIFSPGLKAAVAAVKHIGDVFIVAPRYQQTAMSRSFPKGDSIGIIEQVSLEIDSVTYAGHAVYGSPAQAVSHAVLELVSSRPSLCVCGINYGENLGTGLFPSGTIGAALEASTYGIPGLAMNLEASIEMQHSSDYNPLDWNAAMYFTSYFANLILNEGLPKAIALLNVNIPTTATPETPIRETRQSMQDYLVFKKPGKRDFSKSFRLQTEVKIDTATLEPDSDIKACMIDRVVSVTPLTQDLTARLEWGRPEWASRTHD
jgi:5'-nucleotidase